MYRPNALSALGVRGGTNDLVKVVSRSMRLVKDRQVAVASFPRPMGVKEAERKRQNGAAQR
jgi:hypothetical protein